MTVKELIDKLGEYPGDLPVVKEWFSEDLQSLEWEENVEVLLETVYNQYREPTKFQAVVIK